MQTTPYIGFRSRGFLTESNCTMTVLRGYTQFHIKVEIAGVEGTDFGDQLLQQVKRWHEEPISTSDPPVNPIDQVYRHCLPVLERLAPQTSLQDLSLEKFLRSPTFHLELVGAGIDNDIRIEGEHTCLYTPSFAISPIHTTRLPGACQEIPRFPAHDTYIVPTGGNEKSLDTIQGRVVTAEGAFMYFKPRLEMRELEFERELDILSHIKEIGLSAQIRVPELQGIVVSGENGETTMGMLMTLVVSPETGTHLRSRKFRDKLESHKKWEKQVASTVQELHAHGIVWGDVNPMNVVIDEAMDAWVIDFGGMNNVQFVDDENRETIEGDTQGIMRLFQEWLPSRSELQEED